MTFEKHKLMMEDKARIKTPKEKQELLDNTPNEFFAVLEDIFKYSLEVGFKELLNVQFDETEVPANSEMEGFLEDYHDFYNYLSKIKGLLEDFNNGKPIAYGFDKDFIITKGWVLSFCDSEKGERSEERR